MPTSNTTAAPSTTAASAPPAVDRRRPARGVSIDDFDRVGFGRRRRRHLLAAVAFFRREGHLVVRPGHREASVGLYEFLGRLRAERRRGKLSRAQIDVLDLIGMPWRAQRRGLSLDQRAELVRRYQRGESIRTLAAAFGCAYGTAHRTLAQAKVAFRGRLQTIRAVSRTSYSHLLPV